MLKVIIVLCFWLNVEVRAEYDEQKWKVLLNAQSSYQLNRNLQALNKHHRLSQRCQFELSNEQIPFSCYKLPHRDVSLLDKSCQRYKEKLRDVDFKQIKEVSSKCQRDLKEAQRRLLYIKSAENPSSVYFNEVIDK